MIPLLVIAAWILVLALVAGLCATARGGDVAQQALEMPAVAGWESSPAPTRGQAQQHAISARAHADGSRAAAASDAPLVRSGGSVAA